MIFVKRCKIGRGVFSNKRIEADEVVGQVFGDVLYAHEDEYDDAYCIHYADDNKGNERVLNPLNEFRFLNHSCLPNCRFWYPEDREGVFIATIRTIKKGGQLFINYGNDYYAIACRCGSNNCRGHIGNPVWVNGQQYVLVDKRILKRAQKK